MEKKSWNDGTIGWYLDKEGNIVKRALNDLSLITKRGLDKTEQVNVRTKDDMVIWYFENRTDLSIYECLHHPNGICTKETCTQCGYLK